jgi:hypothetical protein
MPRYYLRNIMAGPASSCADSALQQSTSLVPRPSTSNKAANSLTITASSGSQIYPARIECYFSQSQLALSLSIAKSTPDGVSVRGAHSIAVTHRVLTHTLCTDYCLLLQKQITQNSPVIQLQSLRYVDGCEFWKELYEKIHQENKALQDKFRLLEERQRIRERMPSPDFEDQGESRSSRKRPASFDEIEEWVNGEGTDVIACLGDNYLRISSYSKFWSSSLYTVAYSSSAGLRICRQRHELETTTKDGNIPALIDNLWKSACELLALLEAALSECLMPLWSLKCDDEPRTVLLFRQLMHQIALGFCASFEALNELSRTIPGRKKRFEIVVGLVTFFKHALDYLHTFSCRQAERENNDKQGLQNKRARAEQSEYAVNKYLSIALAQMSQMEWKIGQPGHSEILEGMLCSVLTHTGHLLSYSIFNEHVAGSDKPGNISLRGRPLQTTATKFEFRYIIPILHATLGGTARRELVARVLGDRRLGRSVSLEGQLLLNAKKLLQNTLVKSAVGVEVEGLKLPELPEEGETYSPSFSHRVEQYGSEWFLEAVWALVGWDLAV